MSSPLLSFEEEPLSDAERTVSDLDALEEVVDITVSPLSSKPNSPSRDQKKGETDSNTMPPFAKRGTTFAPRGLEVVKISETVSGLSSKSNSPSRDPKKGEAVRTRGTSRLKPANDGADRVVEYLSNNTCQVYGELIAVPGLAEEEAIGFDKMKHKDWAQAKQRFHVVAYKPKPKSKAIAAIIARGIRGLHPKSWLVAMLIRGTSTFTMQGLRCIVDGGAESPELCTPAETKLIESDLDEFLASYAPNLKVSNCIARYVFCLAYLSGFVHAQKKAKAKASTQSRSRSPSPPVRPRSSNESNGEDMRGEKKRETV